MYISNILFGGILGYSNIFGNVEFFFLRRFSFLEILIFVMYTNIVKVSCIPQFGKFLFLECMQKLNIVSWSLLEFIKYQISSFIFFSFLEIFKLSFLETAFLELGNIFRLWKLQFRKFGDIFHFGKYFWKCPFRHLLFLKLFHFCNC